jgi:hypothetical protein
MADELMAFPETEAVLKQLAEEFRSGYIKNLIKDGHFTYYGRDRLVDTITANVTVDGKSFTASLRMNQYWEYLEHGTGPGRGRSKYWPYLPAISRWVEIKPVIPRPDANGRIPTPKQLAFLISRKIHDQGTKGSHDFQKTSDEIIPAYYERIQDALTNDIGRYLYTVFRL